MLLKKYILLLVITALGFSSCKKWDNHVALTQQNLNENLMQEINNHPELSKFAAYLVKTGLDKEISSSKNYTVFAPTNDALATIAADVIGDTVKLKALLLNHLSGQLFFTRTTADTIRVPMLNGKKVFFYGKKFDDATISQANIFVRNGALHVIDKAIAPLQSAWEYLLANTSAYAQNAYIASLVYQVQDPTLAVLDSINPATGLPVYKPNTGIVTSNTYRTKVYDIANEDSLCTYIVLNNAAYTVETNKEIPYFASTVSGINTTTNAAWNVVKDLAIPGMFLPSQINGVLLSKFNVHVPISSTTIVESHRLSNGIVYIVNAAPVDMAEKIPTVYVQGETPESFSFLDAITLAKVFYRSRFNTSTGLPFKDIYLYSGSTGANRYIDYTTNNLYATKYHVYWVAFSDNTASGQGDNAYGTDSTIRQSLMIGANDLVYAPSFNIQVSVKPLTYSETYIGDYTNGSYDWQLQNPLTSPTGNLIVTTPATRRIRLQAAATVLATTIPYNITLDYVKFVPF